jgi:hypothetical protein
MVGASGCSIDALFRVFQGLQGVMGTTLLGGGRVFYRDHEGRVTCAERPGFARDATLTDATPVFDTTVTTAADFRDHFERPLGSSWHRTLRQPAGSGPR